MCGPSHPDLFIKTRQMFDINTQSAVLAGALGCRLLAPGGLLVFTGAQAVYEQTQQAMLPYAISKHAVHALSQTLHDGREKNRRSGTPNEVEDSNSLPVGTSVVCILPSVIDTEANRKNMAGADTSEWLDPDKIAELLRSWADGKNRPNSGSYAILKHDKG